MVVVTPRLSRMMTAAFGVDSDALLLDFRMMWLFLLSLMDWPMAVTMAKATDWKAMSDHIP